MQHISRYDQFITEELKNLFKSKTIDDLNIKLNKLFDRYNNRPKKISGMSVHDMSVLISQLRKISMVLYDMNTIIKKNKRQYDTTYNEYIDSMLDICNKLLVEDEHIDDRIKKISKYNDTIDLIEIINQSLKTYKLEKIKTYPNILKTKEQK